MKTPTRRSLLGAAGALTVLPGAAIHPPYGGEGSADAELIGACAAFQEANRTHHAFNYDTADMSDETSIALTSARDGLMEKVTAMVATTPEGLRAKAGVARTAMHYDIREFLTDSFLDRAQPYHLLADSLCRDLAGSAAV